MKRENYYDILGIARDGTEAEISRAFKTQARRYHPDVSTEPNAEERFKQINEAHSVLSDSEKRRFYDRYGDDWEQAMRSTHEHGSQDPGSSTGPGGGFGAFYTHQGEPSGFSYHDGYVGEEDLESLFANLFSGGEQRTHRAWSGKTGMHARGRDIEAEIVVRIDDLVASRSCMISLDRGDGTDPPRKIEVKIPPGVTDGSVIRLKGQGEPGVGNGTPGDVRLKIRLAPDERYRVSGYDLESDATLSPWEAALGVKIDVDTPVGPVRLTIPAGTRANRRFRLRGKGLARKDGAGDLFIRIRIDIPERLSEEEKTLFEELAKVSDYKPRGGVRTGSGGSAGSQQHMDQAA